MSRPLVIVVCSLAGLLCAATTANASGLVGAVVADGGRWAAWSPRAGVATVYDDRSRARWSLRVPDCPLGAVHAGRLVLECPNPARYGEPDPVLVDVRTGEQANVGGPDLVGATFERFTFPGVGRYGLLVHDDDYHRTSQFAFDWRSRTRFTLDDPRRTLDLDRPGLTAPLCSPLVRSPTPDADDPYDNKDPYLPLTTWRRWAIEAIPPHASTHAQRTRIRLWRCGEPRPRRLARCGCADSSIGAGIVVWRGDRIRAFDLASRRRKSWPLPKAGYPRVSQAGRTLLIWTQRANVPDPPATLRIVRWPRPHR